MKAAMLRVKSRAEFVRGYVERSGLSPDIVTDYGFSLSGRMQVALPCSCGDEDCQGWGMHGDVYLPLPSVVDDSNELTEAIRAQGE